MEIYSFDELESTQTYIINKIKDGTYSTPSAVISNIQTNGIGSRDNYWSGKKDNFFVSIAIDISSLPSDLPIASSSIYFSWIMKDVLISFGIDVWLKWPNDFYYGNNKVGGTITKKIDNKIIFGIGLNLKDSENEYSSLNTDIKAINILRTYIKNLLLYPEWKYIFVKYNIEFEKSKKFFVHIKNNKTSLKNANLCKDGSLLIDGKRVFSLR